MLHSNVYILLQVYRTWSSVEVCGEICAVCVKEKKTQVMLLKVEQEQEEKTEKATNSSEV